MPNDVTFRDRTLADFLTDLASTQSSPGAGAAGALVLALAAACAAKAAGLSARHRPDDPALLQAHERLNSMAAQALAAADEDARAFQAQLKQADGAAVARLEADGRRVLELADAIDGTCIALQGRVIPTLTGDLVAAAALVQAGRHVQQRNLAETVAPPSGDGSGAGVTFERLVVATGLTAVELATEFDLDRQMLEAWVAGREQAPRAVELAVRYLGNLQRDSRRPARSFTAAADIGGAAG